MSIKVEIFENASVKGENLEWFQSGEGGESIWLSTLKENQQAKILNKGRKTVDVGGYSTIVASFDPNSATKGALRVVHDARSKEIEQKVELQLKDENVLTSLGLSAMVARAVSRLA